MKRDIFRYSIDGRKERLVVCDAQTVNCPRALVVREPYEDASKLEQTMRDRGWVEEGDRCYCPDHAPDEEKSGKNIDTFEWPREKVEERIDGELEEGAHLGMVGEGQFGPWSITYEVVDVDDETCTVRMVDDSGGMPPLQPTEFTDDE